MSAMKITGMAIAIGKVVRTLFLFLVYCIVWRIVIGLLVPLDSVPEGFENYDTRIRFFATSVSVEGLAFLSIYVLALMSTFLHLYHAERKEVNERG